MAIISKLINKYKQTPLQARASVWYTICNLLQKGISFLTIPLYIRMLTTTEYGQYSVFQSWRDILIIFATLNLYCGIFTKAMVDYSEDRDRYTSCMQALSTLLTGVMFAVYLTARDFWNQAFSMDTVTMLLLFAYFVFFPSFTFWSVRQRVEYKYVKMVIITVLVSVLTPAISLLLLHTTNLRENAVIWGFLLVQSGVGAFFYIFQFIKGKCFFHKGYWVHALKFNIPLVPHYLSLIVLGQSDRIMIQRYCGSDKAGIYNLAYQVSMIMNILINAINNTLVPWSYEQLKKENYKGLRDASTKLCVAVAIMTFGAILVGPEIIGILGTADYQQAVWIIPSVAISVYFTFCYGLFSTIQFYYGATWFVMVASVVGAVLNVILNAIFIPMFGFIAAGYTTLVCYFMFMVMHYIFMTIYTKRELDGVEVYHNRFIFASCFVLCILGGVCMMLYNGFVIRYLIIAIFAIVAFIMRKKIIGILKTLKK